MTIISSRFSALLRKCCCFWMVMGPPAGGWQRCATWGQRPSTHHVSQFEASPKAFLFPFFGRCRRTNHSFLQFSPYSAGERQASHKKIKDCEMTESRFLAFARLLSIEPFSEAAAIVPWAEKSRQVLENQDRKKKKKRQSRKTLRQSCNLTEWAINHNFSQRLVYYFTVFHLWKSNYCYLSAKTSGQTSAGNVILSNEAFIKQFKFSI